MCGVRGIGEEGVSVGGVGVHRIWVSSFSGASPRKCTGATLTLKRSYAESVRLFLFTSFLFLIFFIKSGFLGSSYFRSHTDQRFFS